MRTRPQKVASAIRREVSSIIQKELRDPRIGFTTVTRIEITPDLRCAKIYYSVFGNDKKKKSTQVALNNASGFVRGLIGDRLKLRFAPDIIFKMDKSAEYTERVNKILDKIHKEKEAQEK
ncbi:MAG: 30S ribosome-binding factor RbfA [Candidatus Omnitrophota bacterium]|nr:30S ribosome-binding factor RbfA [Candidatus Omnitrophota bacterium]